MKSERGQTLVEMAFVLPIILMVSLGVVEVSYAVLHQHVISRITREGANLISRDVTLLDASNAIKNMTTTPVDFANGSQLVLSVLKKGAVVGSTGAAGRVSAWASSAFAISAWASSAAARPARTASASAMEQQVRYTEPDPRERDIAVDVPVTMTREAAGGP